jgi:hypothetical protein
MLFLILDTGLSFDVFDAVECARTLVEEVFQQL